MTGFARHDQEAAAARAGVTIRAPRNSDVEQLTTMWNEPSVYSGTLQLPWTSIEAREQRFHEIIRATGPAGRMVVAEDVATGAVVGSGNLNPETNPRRKHCGGIGMMVATEFHGRGVGTALMAALMHLADNWLQLTRVTLDVYVDNEPAVALYRKFGFEVEGRHVRDTFRDGEYIDTFSMARLRELP